MGSAFWQDIFGSDPRYSTSDYGFGGQDLYGGIGALGQSSSHPPDASRLDDKGNGDGDE